MKTYLLVGAILLVAITCFWANDKVNNFTVEENHWVSCGSGFFYNVIEMEDTDNTYESMETISSLCTERKQKKRGIHEVTINHPHTVGRGMYSITDTDDVYIDGLLVINWEVSPEDHYNILKAYLED